jgi:hypothetical protein
MPVTTCNKKHLGSSLSAGATTGSTGVDVSGATEFAFTDDTRTSNQKPVRTFSKASDVTSVRTFSKASDITSTTGTTAVEVGGTTEFDFTDDTRTIDQKPVPFSGRRDRKNKVLKSPVRKLNVLKKVATVPPPDLKVTERIEEATTVVENATTVPPSESELPPGLKVLAIVLDTLDSIQARSPGFKAVAPELTFPHDDLVETVKALKSPVSEVEVTENVTTVPPSDLKVLKTPELKVVTQETNLPPHDLVETVEAVKTIKGVKAEPSSELKALAPETKSTPAHDLVETGEAIKTIEGIKALETELRPTDCAENVELVDSIDKIDTVALETKAPPPDLVDSVKAVENIEGVKPPADLVLTIESVDYSLSDVLPDDDVSLEFSRVAAKQTPSIDPVLLIYPFVGGTAVENAAAGFCLVKRLFKYQRNDCL